MFSSLFFCKAKQKRRFLSENLTGQTPAARRVFTRLTAGFFPLSRLCRSFHLVSVFHKGKNPITSEGIFAKFSVSLLFFCKAKQKRRFLSKILQDRHRRHAAFYAVGCRCLFSLSCGPFSLVFLSQAHRATHPAITPLCKSCRHAPARIMAPLCKGSCQRS